MTTNLEQARRDLVQASVVLEVAARALKGFAITDPRTVELVREIHTTASTLLQQVPPDAPATTEPA